MNNDELKAQIQTVVSKFRDMHGVAEIKRSTPELIMALRPIIQEVQGANPSERDSILIESMCDLTPSRWWLPRFVVKWFAVVAVSESHKLLGK